MDQKHSWHSRESDLCSHVLMVHSGGLAWLLALSPLWFGPGGILRPTLLFLSGPTWNNVFWQHFLLFWLSFTGQGSSSAVEARRGASISLVFGLFKANSRAPCTPYLAVCWGWHFNEEEPTEKNHRDLMVRLWQRFSHQCAKGFVRVPSPGRAPFFKIN